MKDKSIEDVMVGNRLPLDYAAQFCGVDEAQLYTWLEQEEAGTLPEVLVRGLRAIFDPGWFHEHPVGPLTTRVEKRPCDHCGKPVYLSHQLHPDGVVDQTITEFGTAWLDKWALCRRCLYEMLRRDKQKKERESVDKPEKAE